MDLDPAFNTVLPLSWRDFHRDALALAAKLARLGPFAGIVAVTRGGLVPAAIVARVLDLRLVETVCIASYGDGKRQHLDVLKRMEGDGDGWVVIDDLVDSGATARAVRDMLPAAHYATLYAKPEGKALVDTFVAEVEQAVWIVFPWESDEVV
jgi:xanthine phosphoribosyltransferase